MRFTPHLSVSEQLGQGKAVARFVTVKRIGQCGALHRRPAALRRGAEALASVAGKSYYSEGLPSIIGGIGLRLADYDIYVRDRCTLAHFTGKNYVLPRSSARKAFPLSPSTRGKSLSTLCGSAIAIFCRTVRSEDFLSQLAPYKIEQYIRHRRKKNWSGTLDVSSELNAEVTTAFPVMEASRKARS